jgi:uncharacterized membrane protein YfcA
MLLAAVGLGLVIGVVIGALGGGGSILTVPVLVFALGLGAQEATTASLVIVGVTAAVAAVSYARSGHTRWRTGLTLAAAGVPASVLGSYLNRSIDENVLLLAFAAVMLLAAVGMLMRTQPGDEGATSAGRPDPQQHRRLLSWRLVSAGLVIGFLTGFLGVGGGFVIVPVLVLSLGLAMPAAVGTSLLVIALNSGVALAARSVGGSFAWEVIVPFTAAAVAGSLLGKRVADRLPSAVLTRAFAVLLVLVAGYIVVRAVPDLA